MDPVPQAPDKGFSEVGEWSMVAAGSRSKLYYLFFEWRLFKEILKMGKKVTKGDSERLYDEIEGRDCP